MNEHMHDETLYDVAAETIESLAMIFLVEPDETPASDGAEPGRASVQFTGPFDGSLELTASAPLLDELAANMLGLPEGEQPEPDARVDALKELLNVVCGNLLPAVAGTRAVFHIGVPEAPTADEPAPQPAGCRQAGSTCLYTVAGTLELTFYVREPATAEKS